MAQQMHAQGQQIELVAIMDNPGDRCAKAVAQVIADGRTLEPIRRFWPQFRLSKGSGERCRQME